MFAPLIAFCLNHVTEQDPNLCLQLETDVRRIFQKAKSMNLPKKITFFPRWPIFASLNAEVFDVVIAPSERLDALIGSMADSYDQVHILKHCLNSVWRELKTSRSSGQMASFSENDPILGSLSNLSTQLLAICIRTSNNDVQRQSARCLGLLGAVDPSRFPHTAKKVTSSYILENPASNTDCIRFVCHLTSSILCGHLRAANAQEQSRFSYIIQELFKTCGFSQHRSASRHAC